MEVELSDSQTETTAPNKVTGGLIAINPQEPHCRVIDRVVEHFRSGAKKIPWKTASLRKVWPVWQTYGKLGLIKDEVAVEDLWLLTYANLLKVCVLSDLVHTNFLNDAYDFTPEDEERFYDYIWPEGMRIPCYTDQGTRFGFHLNMVTGARTAAQKLVAVDRIFNIAHGRGAVADWFIEGGVDSLNRLSGCGPAFPELPDYWPEEHRGRIEIQCRKPEREQGSLFFEYQREDSLATFRRLCQRIGFNWNNESAILRITVPELQPAITFLNQHDLGIVRISAGHLSAAEQTYVRNLLHAFRAPQLEDATSLAA